MTTRKLSISLSESKVKQLDGWAERRGATRSGAITRMIELVLLQEMERDKSLTLAQVSNDDEAPF